MVDSWWIVAFLTSTFVYISAASKHSTYQPSPARPFSCGYQGVKFGFAEIQIWANQN